MQFSLSLLALGASLISVQAEAHSHLHQRAHARDVAKRAGLIQLNAVISVLPAVINPDVKEGKIASLPYTQEIVNNATVAATYICWRSADFAVPHTPYNPNPAPPLVTLEIPAGETKYVSFSDNFSGACAPVYGDTIVGPGGNIPEAWIEMTTTNDKWASATVDVSYQPNTKGRWTSVEVDGCISDKSLCSFSCREGLSSCVNKEDVTFKNCSNDESSPVFQVKANFGTYNGALEGGCFIKGTKKFVVTLNSKQ